MSKFQINQHARKMAFDYSTYRILQRYNHNKHGVFYIAEKVDGGLQNNVELIHEELLMRVCKED